MLNGENGPEEPDSYSGHRIRKRYLRQKTHKANRRAAKEALREGREIDPDSKLDGWEVV